MRRAGLKPPAGPPGSAATRVLGLVTVLAVFFALPAALFARFAGGEGSGRLAAMTFALTLPATGALILRLNPDLIPDRETLERVTALEWAALAVVVALVTAGAWWLATTR